MLEKIKSICATIPADKRTPYPPDPSGKNSPDNGATPAAPEALADTFCQSLEAVHGVPLRSTAALSAFLAEHNATCGMVDPECTALLAGIEGLQIDTAWDRTKTDTYQFGLTRATAGIAETGTVVLTDTHTADRLAALAPWIHIAVLETRTLHATLNDAAANLPADPNIIWVTGPSKTADVEGILIEGVHGPGIQAVLLV